MLIKQIDSIGLETLERGLCNLADVRGTAVKACLLAILELEAELGRNHHLITDRPQRLAHHFFVRVRSVRFGCIEERDAAFDCGTNNRERLFAAPGRAIAEADPHAPKAERRHFESALP